MKTTLISMKTVLISAILLLFAAGPVLGSGGLLSIDGTAGITLQQFKGHSNACSVSLVGANLTESQMHTNFRGVDVGSAASGALTVAATTFGGCDCPDISGSGRFIASARGTINLRGPGSCCCHNNNGYVGQVKGTYETSSQVSVNVN